MQIIEMTQAQYIEALAMQKNKTNRMKMKQLAYAVMYGASPTDKIRIPSHILPEFWLDQIARIASVNYQVKQSILIRNKKGQPLFSLDIYGEPSRTLMYSPGTSGPNQGDFSGGNLVAAALKRRGLDPNDFVFSLFDIDVESGQSVLDGSRI